MNGYNLIRAWYNYKFENPHKVKAKHSDFYCYLVDQWNRLGKKNSFGLPTSYTMECLNIGSYNTYKNILNDLIDFGFVKIVKDSKNQHQSKMIALSNFDKALDKALDKATIKAVDEAPDKAPDTITKQYNNTTKNNETSKTPNPLKGESFDFDKYLNYINETFGKSLRVVNDKVKRKINARLKEGYKKEEFTKSIKNCKKDQFHIDNGFQYCTPEYFARSQTLDKYMDYQTTVKTKGAEHVHASQKKTAADYLNED